VLNFAKIAARMFTVSIAIAIVTITFALILFGQISDLLNARRK